MLATNAAGRLILLSTPAGKRGTFYELWHNGDPTWHRVRVPATDCPRITKEFLDEERRELGEARYREEYCLEFIESEVAAFSSDLIDAAFSDAGSEALMALDRATYQSYPVTERSDWYLGMDVGQSIDPSALAAVQHIVKAGEWQHDDKNRTWKQKKIQQLLVRHLERIPLQTPYPDQIAHVARLRNREPLCNATFGIDFTGCGRPVAELVPARRVTPDKYFDDGR